MTPTYILYLLIGRLLIFIGMKFPLFTKSRYGFVRELFSCDLCLGVWIYTLLSIASGEILFKSWFYFWGLNELITGCVSAFLVHVFLIGWREKFQTIVIE
jgi:hypothetical protein